MQQEEGHPWRAAAKITQASCQRRYNEGFAIRVAPWTRAVRAHTLHPHDLALSSRETLADHHLHRVTKKCCQRCLILRVGGLGPIFAAMVLSRSPHVTMSTASGSPHRIYSASRLADVQLPDFIVA